MTLTEIQKLQAESPEEFEFEVAVAMGIAQRSAKWANEWPRCCTDPDADHRCLMWARGQWADMPDQSDWDAFSDCLETLFRKRVQGWRISHKHLRYYLVGDYAACMLATLDGRTHESFPEVPKP